MTRPIRFIQLPRPFYMNSILSAVTYSAPYVVRAVTIDSNGDVDADAIRLHMPVGDRELRRRLGQEALRVLGSKPGRLLAGCR